MSNDTAEAHVEKIIALARDKRQRKSESPNQGHAESPRPLMREMPPPDAFPIQALSGLLANAAIGIQDRTRAPIAICGQSVMAAATLTVQAHANVRLPTGQLRPLSNFYATVAVTGERKSAADARHALFYRWQSSRWSGDQSVYLLRRPNRQFSRHPIRPTCARIPAGLASQRWCCRSLARL